MLCGGEGGGRGVLVGCAYIFTDLYLSKSVPLST